MSVSVVHPRFVDGEFDYREPLVKADFNGLEQAGEYLEREVHPNVSIVQRNQLRALREKVAGTAGPVGYIDHLTELTSQKGPGKAPSPQTLGFLGICWPWHVNFYQDINQGGDSFSLGVVQQTSPLVALNPALLGQCDWDSDLTQRGGPCNGNWNDCISSVDCCSFDKYWALCEDIHFQGQVYIGVGKVDNLVPLGWNDITSSIVMNSTPANVVQAALRTLIQGGA